MSAEPFFDRPHELRPLLARFLAAPAIVLLVVLAINHGVSSATPEETFIQNLYQDLLGRQPSSSDQQFWQNFLTLNGNSQSTRQQIALNLLTSAEYRTKLLQSFYMSFLGRSASSGEVIQGLNLLGGGSTDEQVMAGILGSTEYFNLGGGTNAGFVSRIFQDLLGRTPSSGESQTFINLLTCCSTRTAVALDLLSSSEYRTRLVQGFFQRFLGRQPAASEVSSFVGSFGIITDEQEIAVIVGSDEYFGKAAPPTATPTPTLASGTATATSIVPTPTRTTTPVMTPTAPATPIIASRLIIAPPPHIGDPIGPVSGTERNLARALEEARAASQAAPIAPAAQGSPAGLRPPNTGDAGLADHRSSR